ncbi:Rho guanyl nucleotide exchange factor [Periconia macrospinosa]|uniref:Rho guanyl nucleotide exchange factor n=1 Tax=Periconia macrospinosa TaxID=97972 RepID=A0A2V1DIG5_9PLEO|nr:Rho guanyl nucleotide exchange factor [Periconia macrospinosa]
MAYVLSLRPQSPLKRSFSDNPYLQSCSPLKDVTVSALRDITTRNASVCSLYSSDSTRPPHWLRGTENTPSPGASRSVLNLVPEKQQSVVSPAENLPRKRNCGPNRPPPFLSTIHGPSDPHSSPVENSATIATVVEDPPDTPESVIPDDTTDDGTEFIELYEAMHIPIPQGCSSDNTDVEQPDEPPEVSVVPIDPQPFRRWMSTLRRRHVQKNPEDAYRMPAMKVHAGESEAYVPTPCVTVDEAVRRISESMTSSIGCVVTMKSASITLASASIAPRSDSVALRGMHRFGNRSTHYSDVRRSTDSHGGALGTVIDEGAWLRSLSRRKVVEELISSEESYISDLKVLINDYFIILTSVPTLPAHTRTSIQQNISQILQLHEDLLAELQQVIPQADSTQSAQQETFPTTRAKHIRFHSADLMPGRLHDHKISRRLRHSLDGISRSSDVRLPGMASDTKTVGDIARIFNKHMKRFFTYEEYGAHWTTMSQDLTSACKNMHGWQEYERGVEALSKVVASENNRQTSSRKALSFPDLLIKPIQRVCKYPLLFEDLCRHTPVYDDPEVHAELEKALFRLQETIREVNKAKDDPRTRRLIEITWQLQDRLFYPEQTIPRALIFRLLGHVLLCGVLHVAYQTPERTRGQYMVCVLYKSCLVLATTSRAFTPYSVVASIALANGTIEEADNGRGLQCHTAPHTWKLVFEHGHRLHEILLSACSSQEEEVWKKQLRERIVCETQEFSEGQSTMQDMFSSLSLDIKSIGPVFGHANSLVRRMSVHRAATLSSKQSTTQIIIKNTQAQKMPEPPPTFAPTPVSRSQSHMSATHIPTLAPRRTERIRLETALEDIWTKDLLPYPGMGNRRVENQIRASANSVIRKLSMASIASNFSRRSPSYSSMSNTRSEDSFGSKVHKISQGNLRARSAADRRPAPAVVDFHNAPAAFLPTDFELQGVRPPGRRRRLANRAAGMERGSEKTTPNRPKRTRRLSSHIMNLPRTDMSSLLETGMSSTASHSTAMCSRETHTETTARNTEVSKQKRKEASDRNSSQKDNASPPLAKRFLKSKSKVFKFWA